MLEIKTDSGIGEYSFSQVIIDEDTNTFVDIVGLKRSGFRSVFQLLYGLMYLVFPSLRDVETSSSHPATLLKKDPDRSTVT